MRIISLVALFALIMVVIAFASLNAQSIDVNYLLGRASLPLVLVMFINLVFGALIGYLVMGFKVIRLNSKIRQLNSQLKKAQKSLDVAKTSTKEP